MSNFTREEQNNANALIGPTLVMSLISRLASKGILDYKDVEAIFDGAFLVSEHVQTNERPNQLARLTLDEMAMVVLGQVRRSRRGNN
jgi:hypothetical protein